MLHSHTGVRSGTEFVKRTQDQCELDPVHWNEYSKLDPLAAFSSSAFMTSEIQYSVAVTSAG